MKRVGSWVFDVDECAAHDITSNKGLRVTVWPKEGHSWAVVLFDTGEPKGSYLCVVDWADSQQDAMAKLRAAVEELSGPSVNMDRVIDQLVGAIQYLRTQAEETDKRLDDLVDEMRRRFGMPDPGKDAP